MRRIILIILVVLFGFSVSPAYSYWIWTPKTGKWINPKRQAKPDPKSQFEFAKSFYDTKDYEQAKREFKKVLKEYSKSFEASEAQYYLAVIEEKQGNLYPAFLAYQAVIDKYPFSERIGEIVQMEYNIAEAFMSGEKRKAMGVVLPVENPAIEILNKVIDNSTYGPLAPKAQYKLGLVLKSLLRPYEAEDAFNKVVANYPDSEWAEPARFQIASCRAMLSKSPDYDQGSAAEAKQKFEGFVKDHPDAELSKDAEKNIESLSDKEAESKYNIAKFYQKQKAFDAAKIYYQDVIDNYSQTKWAEMAKDALQLMETKK